MSNQRYELSVVLLLDESLPENDYNWLRERIAEALRSECIDFDPASYRLRGVDGGRGEMPAK